MRRPVITSWRLSPWAPWCTANFVKNGAGTEGARPRSRETILGLAMEGGRKHLLRHIVGLHTRKIREVRSKDRSLELFWMKMMRRKVTKTAIFQMRTRGRKRKKLKRKKSGRVTRSTVRACVGYRTVVEEAGVEAGVEAGADHDQTGTRNTNEQEQGLVAGFRQ